MKRTSALFLAVLLIAALLWPDGSTGQIYAAEASGDAATAGEDTDTTADSAEEIEDITTFSEEPQEDESAAASEDETEDEETDDTTTWGSYGESLLSGTSLGIYQMLREAAEDLAQNGGSTQSLTYIYENTITASSYLNAIISMGTAAAQIAYDEELIIQCLLADCPYDLYWFDKTAEVGTTMTAKTSGPTTGTDDDGNTVYTVSVTGYIYFWMPVSADYQDSSSDDPEYTVSASKAAEASAAASAAKEVVETYASYSDLDKLTAYMEYICEQVSYNGTADEEDYGNPWQLIYVFDGDEDTNVVCEGYAKAFKYLCDLSTFESVITCYTVTGTLTGATTDSSDNAHMWNIVSIDGESYLVDLANSDTAMIGENGDLALVGSESGSVSDGYSFTIDGTTVTYVYDDDTASFYTEEILTLAGENCNIEFSTSVPDVTVSYSTHVQTYGWLSAVSDGATSGTTGLAKRMEAIQISVTTDADLGISYRTYLQTYGWGDYVSDGATSGTTGLAKRLEAIQIVLTGDDAGLYDVYYRVHCQTYGWLGWAKNGEVSGTSDYAKRVEAIQIVIVPKGTATYDTSDDNYLYPKVTYSVHSQTYGWMSSVSDGETAGTTGQSKRLEAIQITVNNAEYSGSIRYRCHVQTYGWETTWSSDGGTAGTTGLSKRLEAIQIELTGELAEQYDVYYRVHCQTFGWLGWAKNGESAGSAGYAKRVEAIQIVLVKKGGDAPGSTANHYYEQ